MLTPVRTRVAGRNLSVLFGIFVSAVLSFVVLQLIFAQLGSDPQLLAKFAIFGPLAAMLAIGSSVFVREPRDYFVAGRKIPPIYNGLLTTFTALGVTGVVSLTGLFFFLGADALAFSTGVCLGLFILTVLVAPYVRKDGAYTLASYLARRFESRLLRLLLGFILAVPCLLLLIAEFKIGVTIAAHVVSLSEETLSVIGALIVIATVVVGGMRGLSWSGALAGVLVLIALMLPAATQSVVLTNIPIPQVSHGMMLQDLDRLEVANGLAARPAAEMAVELPGIGLERLTKPAMQLFTALSPTGFVLLMLTVAFGVASLPTLAARAATAESVFHARRAFGWSVTIAAIVFLTLASLGVIERLTLLRELPGKTLANLPEWLETLTSLGYADYESQAQKLNMSDVRFTRDGALVMLPIIAGFPAALYNLVIAGVLAAAVTGAAAQVSAIANSWAEDVVFAWNEVGRSDRLRVLAARGLAGIVAALGAWLASVTDADPFRLFIVALALSASAAFPLVVMSVWWKRINQWGAMAGLLAGFGVALVYAVLVGATGGPPVFGLGLELIAVLGVPAGAIAAVVVSLMTPAPEKRIVELVRDIRVPGGETVYDREERLAKAGSGLKSARDPVTFAPR